MFFKSWWSVQQTWKKLLKPPKFTAKTKRQNKILEKTIRGCETWACFTIEPRKWKIPLGWGTIWRGSGVSRGRNSPCFWRHSDHRSKYRSRSNRYISKAQWSQLIWPTLNSLYDRETHTSQQTHFKSRNFIDQFKPQRFSKSNINPYQHVQKK